MEPAVDAAVVTYNRKELLIECLEALARQTHPLRRVLVVDNASTDGTLDLLIESGIATRLPVRYLRLERNGGGAEGFHYAVARAREWEADWLWLMDDDCAPEPAALADLLASPRAAHEDTAILAPLVVTPDGRPLPLNRGWLRRRWFLGPVVGLDEDELASGELEVDFASLVGPLVRGRAARAVDPPRREFFIWWDDVEWVSRVRAAAGRVWLVPTARIGHADPRPMHDVSLRTRWRDFRQGYEFAGSWKRTYGVRNLLYTGRREGWLTAPTAASFMVQVAARVLLFERSRLRSLRLLALYARDGWRGRFRTLSPPDWAGLERHSDPVAYIDEHAMSYEHPTAGEDRPLEELAQTGAPR